MRDDPVNLDTLLEQFAKLGRRDRGAVLKQLTPDERGRIEGAMIAQDEGRRREAERVRRAGRQFAGYSPWLAELLQQACANDDPGGKQDANLSGAARRAVVDVHRAIHNEDGATPTGWIAQMRAWVAALLTPQAGGRP
jgi:hypothetical protein